MTTNQDRGERSDDYEPNPFERVLQRCERPRFSIEPVAVAWDAVAFRVSGDRDGVACVPRAELTDFFDKLDAGALDELIGNFLASPPSGRILRAASQTGKTGLFDEMESQAAIVPPERVPGRPRRFGIGGSGGSPANARDHKGRRRRRGPRRLLVVATALSVTLAAAGAFIVTHRGSSGPPALAAKDVAGTYSFTRTVTVGNANLPAGTVDHSELTIAADCGGKPESCILKSKEFTSVEFSVMSIRLVGTATEACVSDPTITVTDDFDIELRATQFDTRTGRQVPTRLEGTEHLSSRVGGCPNVTNVPVTFSLIADRKT